MGANNPATPTKSVPSEPSIASPCVSSPSSAEDKKNETGVGSKRWKREVEGPYRRLDPNPSKLDLVRLALCTVTIVPIRIILIAIAVPGYYILARCFLAIAPERPWTHAVNIYFVRMASWLLLRLMGFWRVEVKGLTENAGQRGDPRVFVANHISYVEIIYLLAELGPSFVMKRTCLRVPLIGSIAVRVLDSVSVDNKGGKEGGSGSEAILDRLALMFGKDVPATDVVKGERDTDPQEAVAESWGERWKGNPLLLFPEGTTSNGSCLLRFKTGVFGSGMPVYPVTVQYDFRRFSPAFESIYFSVQMLRTLAEPANHLRVEYFPRYCPTPEERADRALYAKNVQRIFCKALNLPAVESGYAEKLKYHGYLRKQFLDHPWGAAAILLPAPDRHPALVAQRIREGYGKGDTDNGRSLAVGNGGCNDAVWHPYEASKLPDNEESRLRRRVQGPVMNAAS